eukprot:856832-Pleurochrysis_carterae.AAC.3
MHSQTLTNVLAFEEASFCHRIFSQTCMHALAKVESRVAHEQGARAAVCAGVLKALGHMCTPTLVSTCLMRDTDRKIGLRQFTSSTATCSRNGASALALHFFLSMLPSTRSLPSTYHKVVHITLFLNDHTRFLQLLFYHCSSACRSPFGTCCHASSSTSL